MNLIREALSYSRGAVRHPKVRKALVTFLGFLAADLVLMVVLWAPAAIRHHQLKKGIGEYHRAQEEALSAQETAAHYQELVRSTGSLLGQWENPVNQSGLIQSLTRLAAKSELKIISQDFDTAVSKGGGHLFKQNLSLAGTYGELRRFLADIENLPNLTVVEQTRLERAGEGGSQLRAFLQLCTYNNSSGERP